MDPVIHFEIQAGDPARAIAFYEAVFQWKFEDYSQYTGKPYWGVITKEGENPGINGGLAPRSEPLAPEGTSPRAFECTMVVADYNQTEALILRHGGSIHYPKHALPGLAWQGYYKDTEGNVIGVHQPDENAR